MTIGASYGDAYFAGIAAGLVAQDDEWSTISDVVEPDPSAKLVYDELFDLYKGLYLANREDMHRIADLQERDSAGDR